MMTKAGRVFNSFAVAGLIFGASVLSACSSGNSSNSNSSNSTVTASSKANAGAVETKTKDTSPVTIKISDLFAEAQSTSVSSMMQTYSGRQMSVTEGVLYEFNVDA
jgi:predicted component of type VI protein secretion system